VRESCSRHGCRYRCSASEERKTDFPLRVRLSPIGLASKRAEAEEEGEEVSTIQLRHSCYFSNQVTFYRLKGDHRGETH
jgi:hypothetical protein